MVPRMTATAMLMRRVLGETFMLTFLNDTGPHDHGQPVGGGGDVIWLTSRVEKGSEGAREQGPSHPSRKTVDGDLGREPGSEAREQGTVFSCGRKPLGMSGRTGPNGRKL